MNVLVANKDFQELNTIYDYLVQSNKHIVMKAPNIEITELILIKKKVDVAIIDWDTLHLKSNAEVTYYLERFQTKPTDIILLCEELPTQNPYNGIILKEKPIDKTIVTFIEKITQKSAINYTSDSTVSIKTKKEPPINTPEKDLLIDEVLHNANSKEGDSNIFDNKEGLQTVNNEKVKQEDEFADLTLSKITTTQKTGFFEQKSQQDEIQASGIIQNTEQEDKSKVKIQEEDASEHDSKPLDIVDVTEKKEIINYQDLGNNIKENDVDQQLIKATEVSSEIQQEIDLQSDNKASNISFAEKNLIKNQENEDVIIRSDESEGATDTSNETLSQEEQISSESTIKTSITNKQESETQETEQTILKQVVKDEVYASKTEEAIKEVEKTTQDETQVAQGTMSNESLSQEEQISSEPGIKTDIVIKQESETQETEQTVLKQVAKDEAYALQREEVTKEVEKTTLDGTQVTQGITSNESLSQEEQISSEPTIKTDIVIKQDSEIQEIEQTVLKQVAKDKIQDKIYTSKIEAITQDKTQDIRGATNNIDKKSGNLTSQQEYEDVVARLAIENAKISVNKKQELQTVAKLKTSNPFLYDLIQKVLPTKLSSIIDRSPDAYVDYYPDATCFILKFEDLSLKEVEYDSDVKFFINKLFAHFQTILDEKKLERIMTNHNTFLAVDLSKVINTDKVSPILDFAVYINDFIHKIYVERKKLDNFCLNYIIELHTSSIIAGRVHKKTFAYDIWGKATQCYINPTNAFDVPILLDQNTKNIFKLKDAEYIGQFDNEYSENVKVFEYN